MSGQSYVEMVAKLKPEDIVSRSEFLASSGTNNRRLTSSRYVPCSDPERWSPAFENGTVLIAVYIYFDSIRLGAGVPSLIKINVAGADDTCMARYVSPPDELDRKEAAAYVARQAEVWNRWLSTVSVVDQNILRAMGLELD